jgi:hypothetical protein
MGLVGQTEVQGYDGYGMDPTFVVGSPQYAGQLSMDSFYKKNELRNASSSSSLSMRLRRIPFAFFPHQVSCNPWPYFQFQGYLVPINLKPYYDGSGATVA